MNSNRITQAKLSIDNIKKISPSGTLASQAMLCGLILVTPILHDSKILDAIDHFCTQALLGSDSTNDAFLSVADGLQDIFRISAVELAARSNDTSLTAENIDNLKYTIGMIAISSANLELITKKEVFIEVDKFFSDIVNFAAALRSCGFALPANPPPARMCF